KAAPYTCEQLGTAKAVPYTCVQPGTVKAAPYTCEQLGTAKAAPYTFEQPGTCVRRAPLQWGRVLWPLCPRSPLCPWHRSSCPWERSSHRVCSVLAGRPLCRVSFIASSIGMRTTPAFLSTQ